MNNLRDFIFESMYNMKCVRTDDEASSELTKKATIVISYHGDDKDDCEKVYRLFKDKYGVEGVYSVEGNTLFLPASKQMQKDYTDQEWNPERGKEKNWGLDLNKLRW